MDFASDDHPLQPHDRWMRAALQLARQAFDEGEVPIGAVIVHNDRIIGEGYNQRESLKDPTAHAEMIAITQAATSLESWRLLDCTIYVTLEPCPMCAGALVNARVARLVYGCDDPKAGAVRSLFNVGQDPRLNHRFEVTAGVLATECSDVLRSFFAALRARSRKRPGDQ